MDLVITILISAALLFLMFLYFRNWISQSLNATTLLRDVQDEVDGMVKELNLSAERNIGLLEERIAQLEGLLAQADQKLVLLARELEKKEKSAELYSQLKKVVPVEEPVVATGIKKEAPIVATPEPVKEVFSERPKSLKERVLELRDQGVVLGEIAARVGATQGEVELILSLNPPTGS